MALMLRTAWIWHTCCAVVSGMLVSGRAGMVVCCKHHLAWKCFVFAALKVRQYLFLPLRFKSLGDEGRLSTKTYETTDPLPPPGAVSV